MGQDVSSGYAGMVGVLVPAPWLDPDYLWAAHSTYSQAEPRPGVPEPQQASSLVLEASGSQGAGTSYEVRVQRGGDPDPAAPLGIVWRGTGDTLWRGWDPPRLITSWESLSYSDTSPLHGHTHCARLTSGTVVMVYRKWDSGLRRVYARRRELTGPWTSEVLLYTQPSSAATHDLYPCVVALADGSAIVLHWVEDVSATEAQVRVHRSVDDGATWSTDNAYALQTPVNIAGTPGAGSTGYDLGRLRGAEAGGQVLLIAQVRAHDNTPPDYRETYLQYASSSSGVAFALVEAGALAIAGGGFAFGYQEVLGLQSTFLVVFGGGDDPEAIVGTALESAYQSLSSVTRSTVEDTYDHFVWNNTTKIYEGGDLAACADTDGIIYLLSSQAATGSLTGRHGVTRSTDGGVTWENMGRSSVGLDAFGLWWQADSAAYPTEYSVAAHAGRLLVPHRWEALPGNEDGSLAVIGLGGWSTVTMPGQDSFGVDTRRAGWEHTWLPIELPSDVGWTSASGGTESASLTGGALRITATTGFRYYERTPSGTIAEGLILRSALAVVSGGSLASNDVGLLLRLADGTDDYQVVVRCSTTGIRCWDSHAGAAIGSDVTADLTGGVEMKIGMAEGSFRLWWRERDSNPDKEWTAGPATDSLTDDAASPEASSLIRFGVLTSTIAEVDWFEQHHVSDEYVGPIGLAAGQSNPADLHPRPLASEPTYLTGGLLVRATDGPGRTGQEWLIEVRYDYGIEQIFPLVAPSPRRGWRSTGVGSDQTIALLVDLELLDTDESATQTGLLGVYLDGGNWQGGELLGRTGGSWVSLGSVDTADGLKTLGWARRGNVITPAAGGSLNPYLHANEFAGGYFDLGGGVVRRIVSHSGGVWRLGGGQLPRLVLEDVLGADPTSGTSGLIRPPRLCLLYSPAGADYAGYRLKINAQPTAEGDLRVGTLLAGPVFCTTPPAGAGGISWQMSHGVVRTVARDGTSRARIERPTSRQLQMSWPDPDWEGAVTASAAPTPDWLTAYTGGSGDAVATPGDALRTLEGVVEEVGRMGQPVVALTRVPISSSQLVTLNRREDFLYGWLIGGATRRAVWSVAGERSALVSGGTLTFEEQT